MIIINDFFVRYKEAVSNQMELISKRNNGKIISATRFMGQKPLQEQDKQDNIYVYRPFIYFLKAIREVKKNSKDTVHVFEEESSLWKRILFNSSDNPLFVSMYRRPNKEYAEHLKKYKNLKRVFVELEKHKEILIQYGIQENKIMVTPTPSKIPRKRSNKEFNPSNVNILFASWNNKEGDAIRERGLEYLLQLLKENTNFSLTIPLRDNDTQAFEQMAKKLGVWDRVSLLDIHNNMDTLINLFDNSDFVAFVPQKRIVKDVPNSLIDGLVRGKPVIVSDVIDFSETVSNNNIGYVIPKGKKAQKMDISIDEYAEMSKRAYEYSRVHLQENYVKIIEKGYKIENKDNSKFKRKIKVSDEIIQNQYIENREEDKSENSHNKSLGNIR